MSWTLPDLGNGFGAKVGIFDPKDVAADTAAFSVQQIKSSPRVEAQITWNGDFLANWYWHESYGLMVHIKTQKELKLKAAL